MSLADVKDLFVIQGQQDGRIELGRHFDLKLLAQLVASLSVEHFDQATVTAQDVNKPVPKRAHAIENSLLVQHRFLNGPPVLVTVVPLNTPQGNLVARSDPPQSVDAPLATRLLQLRHRAQVSLLQQVGSLSQVARLDNFDTRRLLLVGRLATDQKTPLPCH